MKNFTSSPSTKQKTPKLYTFLFLLLLSYYSFSQDTTPPVITSSATAAAIDENSGASLVVYTVTATDNVAVTSYAFGGGTDDAAFSIDSATGAVTLTANPDYETKSSYSFDVTAQDAAGNTSTALTVSLAINDLDDEAPVITSSATATAIDENSGASQVVYTVTATDNVAVTSYAFGGGTDDTAFSINSATGAVTLTANPDYEMKSSYSFDVVAQDAVGNVSTPQTVILNINNVIEVSDIVAASTNPASGALLQYRT